MLDKSCAPRFLLTVLALLIVAVPAPSSRSADAQTYTLSEGKNERSYVLYRPAGLDRMKLAPLVVVLHGGFGSGQQAEHAYNWDREADKQGFVVVYPDGVRRSWNAGGGCCGPALYEHSDDLAFLTHVIQTVANNQHIDPARIYLTGISNGAAMAYHYACQGSIPVAAVGSVAGSMSYACPNPRPTSVMEIHGLDDKNILFNGGIGPRAISRVSWLPVPQTLSFFIGADNCQSPVAEQQDPIRVTSWNCDAGRQVTLITIAGAGHQWPGAQPKNAFMEKVLRLDPPSQALDATSTLWRFFAAHHS